MTDHNNATLLALNAIETSQLANAYLDLLDIIVSVTHDEQAIEFYRPRWQPIVTQELKRRQSTRLQNMQQKSSTLWLDE
jgi:hypothetical protein